MPVHQEDMSVTGRKATRASKPKVRTGCHRCKQRRVKCDESKPACLRCSKSNLECTGYGISITFNHDRRILPVRSPKQQGPELMAQVSNIFLFYRGLDALAELNETENAAYDFCRSRTVNDLATLQCDHFWTTSILSGCHSEPAILHAVLALGSIHRAFNERPAVSSAAERTRFTNSAYSHYGRAVKHLRARCAAPDASHLRTVLMVCVILLCFDLITQRYGAACLHLEHGRKILRLLMRKFNDPLEATTFYLPPKSQSIDDELVYSWAQLDLQSTNFGGKRPQFNLLLDPNSHDINGFEMPYDFASPDDAARHMMILLSESFKFRGSCPDPKIMNLENREAVATQARLSKLLEQWKAALDRSPSLDVNTLELSTSSTARKSLILKIQHALLSINVGSCLTHGEELQFDAYIEHFSTIVSAASLLVPHLPVFNLDMAIVHPLYVVVVHCRHPNIRRKAIQVMSQSRREGLWDSRMIETCGREIMKLEETEAGYVHNSNSELRSNLDLGMLIPESVRVSEIWATFPNEDMSLLRITMRRKSHEPLQIKTRSDLVEAGLLPAGDWEEIERFVPWSHL